MSLGIANVEIEKFTKNNGNNLKRNFTGVSGCNHINHFISYHNSTKEKKCKRIDILI